MSFSESPFNSQGRQWICFSSYRMSYPPVQRLNSVAAPEGSERRHWGLLRIRQCPLSRNAYRIGRGTVLEGEIPGILLSPRQLYAEIDRTASLRSQRFLAKGEGVDGAGRGN